MALHALLYYRLQSGLLTLPSYLCTAEQEYGVVVPLVFTVYYNYATPSACHF